MADALTIALTGLVAQGVRVAAAADNIANAGTVGVLPTESAPTSTVYKPLSVSYTALAIAAGDPAGVKATVTQDQNGYSPVYDPTNIYANSSGVIAAPNVDLTKESVDLLEAKVLFKANLAVIKTEKEMMGEVINTVS